MAQALVDLVQKHFPDDIVSTSSQHGDEAIVLRPSAWRAAHELLVTDPAAEMNMLMDLTAVDYPDREDGRFEIVTHLYSLTKGHRLRLKTAVGDEEGEEADVDSLTALWGSANWMERECFDMFGVNFVGHPDLRRILLYPEFEGHPLRKDYPAQKIQPLVPFRDVPGNQKVAPFGETEGMAFGRQTHDRWGSPSEDD